MRAKSKMAQREGLHLMLALGLQKDPVEFSQEMDIGVQDEKGNYRYLKKHLIKSGQQEI